ncbi:probable cytochrome P450 6a13 [Schistocerca serialis cubense]|uniref:probable cytochrome P450 6a13 n=1 Tax=Schistocerca serialis cubense TaxID=2023355 RepID=UPI00214E09B0|nr:probable cytochrome P450 6a13 [Schistocerca serialis cubense]
MAFDWWMTGCLVVAAAWLLWKYLTWSYSHWQRLGVPCPQPSVPFGNVKELMLGRKHFSEVADDIYRQMDGQPFCGFYRVRQPVLLVRDPELARAVMIRDFAAFHDNNVYINEELDPILARNPFFMRGEPWRKLRSQLSPSFTASRLKPMFLLMKEVCDDLVQVLQKEGSRGELEARELCMRYTTDVVSSCAMGIRGGALNDSRSDMLAELRKILAPETLSAVSFSLATIFPFLGGLFRLRILPLEVHNFLCDVVSRTVARRQHEGIYRNDYLQMLVDLKTKGYLDGAGQELASKTFFTDLDIAAQVMTFVADGIHTSSTGMSYLLYELALHPDIQQRLRRELQEAVNKHGGQLGYDVINEASYLDMVVSESLRLHTPFAPLEKICTAPYNLTAPTGQTVSISPGTAVVLPISSIHADPQYFPNPHVFDPERFSPDNKDRTAKLAYMAFGAGPRACIGQRFALSQVKMGVAAIVLNTEIHCSARTPKTIRINPLAVLRLCKDGLWLNFKPLHH